MQGITVMGAVGGQGLARLDRANISAADRPSWAWPSVSFSRIGRPTASTKAWILVVSPPRERPMQRDAGLNAWLEDRSLACAKANKHPEGRDRTIRDMFEDERPSLAPYVGPFDGFHAVPASASKTLPCPL